MGNRRRGIVLSWMASVAVLLLVGYPQAASKRVGSKSRKVPAHRLAPIDPRFTFTPWQMTTGGGGMPVHLPEDSSRPASGLAMRFDGQVGTRYGKIPPPDSDWRSAPDPSTVRFHKEPTVYPCEREAVYFYFRTTLNVPPQVDHRTVTLSSSRIDERLLVVVNGTPLPQARGNDISLGSLLRPGRNTVTAILGDWCIAADFQGVSIAGKTLKGQPMTAQLRRA